MESTRENAFWLRTTRRPQFAPLEGVAEADVVVVGGGITGLTAALLLQRAGRRVVLLEALQIGGGVTGYTTAHITAAFDSRYADLARDFGEETARLVAESQRAAIDRIAQFVEEDRIACDFRRIPGYLFAEPDDDDTVVRREGAAAQLAGLDVTLLPHAPLPFPTGAALRFEDQARFHPLHYVLALAQLFEDEGGRIFEYSRMTDFEDGTPCRVVTEHGLVRASDVLLCTHSAPTKFSFHTWVAPYRSYVLGVRLAEEPPEGLFFDTKDPYHYLRRVETANGFLFLVGGADHKVGHKRETDECYDELERWTRERFSVREVTDRWSAQVLEPVDGLPYVGKVPLLGHVYVATGFSGNGMTNGTMSALLLSDLVLGQDNPWAPVFKPQRREPVRSFGEYVRENVDYPYHLVADRVQRGEVNSLLDIPKGEGRLVQLGGEKLAVYRDEKNQLTALSPVCPHLYCHVQWNTAEKSWDCPCHGSRFDATGEVIDGPALKSLAPRPLPGEEHAHDEAEPPAPPPPGDAHT